MMYSGIRKEEVLEMNRKGLMREYKRLANMDLNMEVNNRMSDIMYVLVKKYNMKAEEVEALEA